MDEKIAARWIAKQAYRNLWRVASPDCGLDDLIQDGHMCLALIKQTYPKVRDRLLMKLLMVTYTNHITNLANARTRYAALQQMMSYIGSLPGSVECPDAAILMLCAEAPKPISDVIKGLVRADGKQMRAPFRRRADGTRETKNERMCKVAGMEEQPGLFTWLREYLS